MTLPAVAQDRHRPWAELFAIQRNGQERPSQRQAHDRYTPDPYGNESRERRRENMSPEDRRQLRRDVRDAGRDIYPERMPPGRRDSRHR
ncbi:MAG: hypothetical protein WAX67_03415 [Rugosibacter sp.]